MSNTSTHSSTRRLAEGGICIALALVLSYIKIPIDLSFGTCPRWNTARLSRPISVSPSTDKSRLMRATM